MYEHIIVCVNEHVWRPECDLQQSDLSSHHVGPWGEIQVIRLGSKYLYLPSQPFVTSQFLLALYLCLFRGELSSWCWQPGLRHCYWSCKGLNVSDCQTRVSGTKTRKKTTWSGRLTVTFRGFSPRPCFSLLLPGVGISQWMGSWVSIALCFSLIFTFWSIWVPE